MNNDPHDISTEDEGVDEDMMFEFEQELDARLSLASGAHDDDRDARARCTTPVERFAARPRNPVAAVLQSANEIEEEEFASLSASPFCDYGSPAATERMAAAVGSMSAPAYTSEKSVFFDFNGRRKRKYFDDSCCVTPRVRPMAKRAKSFSCVDQVLLPSVASVAVVDATDKKVSPVLGSGQIFLAKRSDSIQIPHRAHRPVAPHAQRSSSGPAREQLTKPMDIPAAASDPLLSQASSWNASVEYFCRRSLDISSPLRIRFRDLVVGSVGRAGSLQTP